ncbi:MAG TPA: glycosyltransferase family 39 protein [Chloroflexota bacterium]|nr:glycosyltransferase family 39 protein [Chloroflexota bacterium]
MGSWVLLALGGVYALLGAVLLAQGVSASGVTWLWLMALAASVAGAFLIDCRAVRQPTHKRSILELGLLLAILAVAVWLRFPNLASIPPNLHGDEVSIGLDARKVMAGLMPAVFATGWYDVPALSFTIHAATMRLFGDDLFGLRLASALEGILSVVLLYLLAGRLWGPRPALLAAAFLAIAAWHIHFSRTGFHYMQAPVATLLVLYFLVRGLQDRRVLDWVLCGFAIGLCTEVYYAARLAPVIAVVYLGYRALTARGFARTNAGGVLAMVFGALVFIGPMAEVIARSPSSFSARTSGVLITSPDNFKHEAGGYHVTTLPEVVAIQADRTLEAFNILGETSLQYGHPGPLLDFWTGALLAMSAIAILLRPGSARGFLLATWVWLTLVAGSVLTIDALFSPRVLPALPALMLGPALILDRAWLAVSSLAGRLGTYLFAVPVVVLLGLALQANVHDYFDVQVIDRQPAGRFTLLAEYASGVEDRYRLYAIGSGDWSFASEAPRFVVPTADVVNVRNGPLPLPLDHIPASNGVAFIVENGAADFGGRMAAIQRAYPMGHAEVISERPGAPTFTSYLVEHADLLAANPRAAQD